jgi:hypothetical protein
MPGRSCRPLAAHHCATAIALGSMTKSMPVLAVLWCGPVLAPVVRDKRCRDDSGNENDSISR